MASPVTWNNHGVLISDPGSVVLESDPYRRLSYTWHTMTPELAEKFGWDQEFAAKLAGEPRSKVTFDIEPVTQGVKLRDHPMTSTPPSLPLGRRQGHDTTLRIPLR